MRNLRDYIQYIQNETMLFSEDLSDLQALNSSTTSDKPTSISSANIHKSKDSDEEMEDVDLKSSSQLLDKDSEPAAQSPECEEEDETSCRGENGH